MTLQDVRFEAKWVDRLPAWAWLALAAVVAAPFPLPLNWVALTGLGPQWPFVERGVPIVMLMAAGFLLAAGRVAAVSWPLAALMVWAGLRAAYHSFPVRSIQGLAFLLMAGFLFVAARSISDQAARRVVWAFLFGVGVEAALGVFNVMGVYPWMTWVQPEHLGKPMGLLTHPNYWGSLMALALPLVWSRLGIIPAALVGFLILKTVSGGPVITAAVAALVMGWPLFDNKIRAGIAAIGAGGIALTMTLHEWRLSGRTETWKTALEEMRKWPLTGQGIGEWRSWANGFNDALYRPQEGKHFMITLQAHNEPLQLAFELGLVGLVLGALLVWQMAWAGKKIWTACPTGMLTGPWWQFGRAPLERAWVAVLAAAAVNMWGSPVLHLPAQGVLVLFVMGRLLADAEALSEGGGNHRQSGKKVRARRFGVQTPDPNGRPWRRQREDAHA